MVTNEDDIRERDRRRYHQIGMLAIYLGLTVLAILALIGWKVFLYIVALMGMNL